MSDGLFITLEGIEGSGKTTQVPGLTARLSAMGYDCLVTREPGGCKLAEKIRAILLDPANAGLVPMAELLLYLADRAQHVQEVIRPALNAGRIVVCDRYADATVAYQGYARGLGPLEVADLNQHATGGLEPDLTLLLDLPAQVGLQRAKRRVDSLEKGQPTEDRFEQEELVFHQKVREGYLDLARSHPDRIVVIDAEGSPDEIASRIHAVIEERISPRSQNR